MCGGRGGGGGGGGGNADNEGREGEVGRWEAERGERDFRREWRVVHACRDTVRFRDSALRAKIMSGVVPWFVVVVVAVVVVAAVVVVVGVGEVCAFDPTTPPPGSDVLEAATD